MFSLIDDLLAIVFGFLDSDTRADVCTVSHQFNKIAMQVSRALSVFPQGYSQPPLPYGYMIGGSPVINNLAQKVGEAHLLRRLRPTFIDCCSMYRGGLSQYMGADDPDFYKYSAITGVLKGHHIDLSMDLVAKYRPDSYVVRALAYNIGNAELIKAVCDLTDTTARICCDSLQYACKGGNIELIEFLLSRPPSIYAADRVSEVMGHACRYGNSQLVDYMIARTEDNRPADFWNEGLIGAARANNLQLTQQMLDNGAIVTSHVIEMTSNHNAPECLRLLLDAYVPEGSKDTYLQSCLTNACEAAQESSIRVLLEYGAQVKGGMIVSLAENTKDIRACVDLLLHDRLSINVEDALYAAAGAGNIHNMKYLVSRLDTKNVDFWRVFDGAFAEEHYEICDYIVAGRSIPSLLHTFVREENESGVKYLIRKGHITPTDVLAYCKPQRIVNMIVDEYYAPR
jgi:hypothetical protein